MDPLPEPVLPPLSLLTAAEDGASPQNIFALHSIEYRQLEARLLDLQRQIDSIQQRPLERTDSTVANDCTPTLNVRVGHRRHRRRHRQPSNSRRQKNMIKKKNVASVPLRYTNAHARLITKTHARPTLTMRMDALTASVEKLVALAHGPHTAGTPMLPVPSTPRPASPSSAVTLSPRVLRRQRETPLAHDIRTIDRIQSSSDSENSQNHASSASFDGDASNSSASYSLSSSVSPPSSSASSPDVNVEASENNAVHLSSKPRAKKTMSEKK